MAMASTPEPVPMSSAFRTGRVRTVCSMASRQPLVVPWWLASRVLSDPFREAIDASNLGDALWPIAVGALAAVVLGRVERYVPLPEGDRIVAGARIERLARRGSEYLEKADLRIEEWPVASLALLGIAITFGAALVLGR